MRRRSKKSVDKDKELAKEYGVTISYWRYAGRKGIYWSLLSQLVRKRDFLRYGTCISCKRKFERWNDAQAGHYAPAHDCGFDLLFEPMNVHAECPSCNNPTFSPGKLIPYRRNLVERYGEEWVKALDERYARRFMGESITPEWRQGEYHNEILKIMEQIKSLDEEINSKQTRVNSKNKKRSKANN